MFISLFKFFSTHISYIVYLYFYPHCSHCNVVFSHTSQYNFTHISQHILYACIPQHILYACIRVSHTYVYVVFSLYISLYSHTSHMFLYSHLIHFVKTFFCNTCIAYVYVSHTFGFDFLFSKAKLHTHLYSIFLKILEYK